MQPVHVENSDQEPAGSLKRRLQRQFLLQLQGELNIGSALAQTTCRNLQAQCTEVHQQFLYSDTSRAREAQAQAAQRSAQLQVACDVAAGQQQQLCWHIAAAAAAQAQLFCLALVFLQQLTNAQHQHTASMQVQARLQQDILELKRSTSAAQQRKQAAESKARALKQECKALAVALKTVASMLVDKSEQKAELQCSAQLGQTPHIHKLPASVQPLLQHCTTAHNLSVAPPESLSPMLTDANVALEQQPDTPCSGSISSSSSWHTVQGSGSSAVELGATMGLKPSASSHIVKYGGESSMPTEGADASCTSCSQALHRVSASSLDDLHSQRGACVPAPVSPACSSCASTCGPAAACMKSRAQAGILKEIQNNSACCSPEGTCGVQHEPFNQLACEANSHAVSSTSSSSRHCSSTCVSGASSVACKGLQSDRPRWRR